MTDKKLLFIQNIDLGAGISKKIEFYEGDNQYELAFSFCKGFDLDNKAYDFVLNTLNEKLKIVANELVRNESKQVLNNKNMLQQKKSEENLDIENSKANIGKTKAIPQSPEIREIDVDEIEDPSLSKKYVHDYEQVAANIKSLSKNYLVQSQLHKEVKKPYPSKDQMHNQDNTLKIMELHRNEIPENTRTEEDSNDSTNFYLDQDINGNEHKNRFSNMVKKSSKKKSNKTVNTEASLNLKKLNSTHNSGKKSLRKVKSSNMSNIFNDSNLYHLNNMKHSASNTKNKAFDNNDYVLINNSNLENQQNNENINTRNLILDNNNFYYPRPAKVKSIERNKSLHSKNLKYSKDLLEGYCNNSCKKIKKNKKKHSKKADLSFNRNEVHLRLYAEAHIRDKRNKYLKKTNNNADVNIQGSNKKGKKNANEIDISGRLYYTGLRRIMSKEKVLQDARDFKDTIMHEECLFKPEINKISTMIIDSKPRPKSVEQRLLVYGKAKQNRQETLKNMKQQLETSGCTFKPNIDKISSQIINEKSRNLGETIPKHEYLYELANIQNERLEQYRMIIESQKTFTPAINQYPQGVSQQLDMSFMERKNYFDQEKEMNHQRIATTYGSTFTNSPSKNMRTSNLSLQKTTQYSVNNERLPFHPQTGKEPEHRNVNKMPVGMYLYEKGLVSWKRKKLVNEEIQKETKKAFNQVKTNSVSEKIVDELRYKKLKEIFEHLDNDNDGIISYNKIDISTLTNSDLKKIAPLLIEMEQMQLVLDINAFMDAGNTLIGMLTLDEKNEFINKNNIKPSCEGDLNCTFKPRINRNSQHLVKKMRSTLDPNTSQDSISSKHVKNCHINNRACKPTKDEMVECTFHPKITKYVPIKSCYE